MAFVPMEGADRFGLQLSGFDPATVVKVVRSFNANAYRPGVIFVDQGVAGVAQTTLDLKNQGGLSIVQTFRANGGPPGTPTVPVTDWPLYESNLNAILDHIEDNTGGWIPERGVCENEANSLVFFNGTGLQYVEILSHFSPIYRARGGCVTDSGIVSAALLSLAVRYYFNLGQTSYALQIAKALHYYKDRAGRPIYGTFNNVCDIERKIDQQGAELDNDEDIVEGMMQYIDTINLHYYNDSVIGLEGVVGYLRAKAAAAGFASLPVMTNEQGYHTYEPIQVAEVTAAAVRLNLGPIVTYGVERPNSQAKGLTYTDGKLRPNGEMLSCVIKNCQC